MYRNKYNARKTIIDGIKFDSKKEAYRYRELKLLLKAGEIKDLELQPKFTLQDSFKHQGKTQRKITYIADFKYYDNLKKCWIVEDTKGFKTDVYNIKKKMFLKKYGDEYNFIEN
ncbi:DUF1064 domain-containing protein [Lagierella sp. ICN-221743]